MQRRHFLGWVVCLAGGCVAPQGSGSGTRKRRGAALGAADGHDADVADADVADAAEDSDPPDADSDADSDAGIDAAADSSRDDAAEDCTLAQVHDVHAQALYYDGTHGPLTGTILASEIAAGEAVDRAFWHGHGGMQHRFVVTEDHMRRLALGERVYIETSEVQRHSHTLFIDPVAPEYAVEDGEALEIRVCVPVDAGA